MAPPADTPDPTGTPSGDGPALPAMPYRVAGLPSRKPTRFAFAPDAEARKAIAGLLDLSDLPYLTFSGEIAPKGRRDLVLTGTLEAVVIQPCSVTADPVRSRITEAVLRRYLADHVLPEGDEVEMPEDDSAEPLPEVIDPAAVAIEALALAVPLYPRSPGAALAEASFAPPGAEPIRDSDLKPFAGLAGLAARLKDAGEGQA